MNGIQFCFLGARQFIPILFFTLSVGVSTCWTQNVELKHFGIKEGLPHKHINDILIHSDGFIWLGTRNGLCRFDGYEFKSVDLPKRPAYMEGSIGPWVGGLSELSDGRILIKYLQHSRLAEFSKYLYDPISEMEISVDENELITNPKKSFNKMSILGSDSVIHSDRYGNQLMLIRKNKSIKAYLLPAIGGVHDISKAFDRASFFPPIAGENFTETFFYSLYNGLIQVRPEFSRFKNYLKSDGNPWDFGLACRVILPLNSDELLVSSQSSDPVILNLLSGKVSSLQFVKEKSGKAIYLKHIQGAVRLPSGDILLSPLFKKLVHVDMLNESAMEIEDSLFLNRHHMISIDDSTVLISGRGHHNNFIVATYQTSTRVFDVRLNDENIETTLSNSYLHLSQDHHVWIGHTDGLYYFNLDNNSIAREYIDKDRSKRPHKSSFEVYNLLSGKSILVLHENQDNKLFIGLDKGGLNILDVKTNEMAYVGKVEGLSDETVSGILPDEKGYWIATYSGLCHYDESTGLINKYFTENGLPHNEFNRFSFARNTEGQYFFGSMNGIVSFNPTEVLKSDERVKINLSEAQYYNKEGDYISTFNMTYLDDPVVIVPPFNRSCQFKFMLDDFVNSPGNSFFYRLEDVNSVMLEKRQTWKQNDNNRMIRFDYLPSGTYNLHVRGLSSTGVLSNTMKVGLIVKARFYETWWFISGLTFLILGVFYGYFRMKMQQVLRIERLRNKLSSDLHDDVGSLLSGVAYQMELLEYSVDEKRKPLVRRLAAASRKAMNQMRDVVWAIDMRSITCIDLVERIREFATNTLEPLDINFNVTIHDELASIVVPSEFRHDLLLICKEFLTNSMKHAHAKNISLSIERRKNRMSFLLQDDGIGMQKSLEQSTGQGLKNIRFRAEKMGAKIVFETNDGFSVQIELPNF